MLSNCRFSFIYLLQDSYELDLHNDFDFVDLHYSLADGSLTLRWQRSDRIGVRAGAPAAVTVRFTDVSAFRFLPRRAGVPSTEDRCVSGIGYLTDEEWSNGSVLQGGEPQPDWLRAFEFQSGAVIAVRAAAETAVITP